MSFYHLGDATFQNGSYNPAYVPNGKFFFGLPGLSGIHLHYNNRLSYKELVSKQEDGTSKVDLRKVLSNLGINNMLSVQTNISLLHVGFVAESGMSFSLFANERIEADLLYDNKVMNFLIKGNTTVLDQKVQIGKTRVSATHFREIGIGATYPSPNKDIVLGARIKYLQGFLNFSTPENQSAHLSTDGETYILNGDVSNMVLRSAGSNIYKDIGNNIDYLIFNQNRGFAVDLGFDWNMNKYNRISASLTDLGYISWKEDIENRFIADTSFTYSGISLKKINNLEEMIKDSLVNQFDVEKNAKSYSTLIGPKAFVSWEYKVNDFGGGGKVISSAGARYVQQKMKFLLGVGYQQKFGKSFVGSANITKLPQQFFNLGAALAVKGGPMQFYLAVDQIYNFDVTRFQSFDARLGINFILGRNTTDERSRRGATTTVSKEKIKKKGPGFSQNQSFMGSKVKVIRQEEIYNIIPRQERRRKEEYMSDPPE